MTKYGAKRGGIALGRFIPFGVGAAVGGAVNYTMARSFGRWILRFYGQMQPAGDALFIPADT